MRRLTSRTVHRYLSVVIGIQLLFWTISGLVFSWNPIAKVRGEHLVREVEKVDLSSFRLLGVNNIVERHKTEPVAGRLVTVELRMMLDSPVYEFSFAGDSSDAYGQSIFDATTGEKLSPISEEQARKIAIADFAEDAGVSSAELMEGDLSSHSEYRGKELPVWRVVLDHNSGTVIYVSANRGVVTTRRNNRWRLFDFFWMLHTMDYQGRDNFNSWILRSFSVFGVATVLSGYWLWWRSSRVRRKWRKSSSRNRKQE